MAKRLSEGRSVYVPIALGLLAACVSLLPSLPAKAAVLAPALIAPFCWWMLLESHRWLAVFLCSLIILPPLPIRLGDSGPHPALIVFCLGLLSTTIHVRRWGHCAGRLGFLLSSFTGVLLFSVITAALNSGTAIAIGSLSRVFLFAIAPFVFFFAVNTGGFGRERALGLTRWLFRAAVLAALFACIDFYFQLPTPAGFGPQFVWLDEGVFRRAQGLFYEASTLGNFCAFFLVMILVALRRPASDAPVPRVELTLGAIVFATALIFSYSRGSLLNLFCAGLTVVTLNRKLLGRSALFLVGCAVLCPALVYVVFPSFAQSYLSRLFQSLAFIWSTPNGVLSGRVDSWAHLTRFLADEPWRVFFGIGYKTLPYSDLLGSSIIADNTYLSLLIETGVGGLLLLLLLNLEILKKGLVAFRSSSAQRSFFGEWIFCFWIGELVQMTSGDLITYWRLLPLYLWVLAMAVLPDGEASANATQNYTELRSTE
ncbi:MAG: O-antigen ligase family protein [Bryobacteraceae bacterium]